MTKDKISPELSPEDKALVDKFNEDYVPGITFVKRTKSPTAAARIKRVNVYVDGVLTVWPEDLLDRLIEIGFVEVTVVREGIFPD